MKPRIGSWITKVRARELTGYSEENQSYIFTREPRSQLTGNRQLKRCSPLWTGNTPLALYLWTNEGSRSNYFVSGNTAAAERTGALLNRG